MRSYINITCPHAHISIAHTSTTGIYFPVYLMVFEIMNQFLINHPSAWDEVKDQVIAEISNALLGDDLNDITNFLETNARSFNTAIASSTTRENMISAFDGIRNFNMMSYYKDEEYDNTGILNHEEAIIRLMDFLKVIVPIDVNLRLAYLTENVWRDTEARDAKEVCETKVDEFMRRNIQLAEWIDLTATTFAESQEPDMIRRPEEHRYTQ